MAIGAWIRHYFNLRHQGRTPGGFSSRRPPRSSLLAVLIRPVTTRRSAAGRPPPFAQVQAIVQQRCAPCHSTHPTQPGFSSPPAGILLDTAAEIEREAR